MVVFWFLKRILCWAFYASNAQIHLHNKKYMRQSCLLALRWYVFMPAHLQSSRSEIIGRHDGWCCERLMIWIWCAMVRMELRWAQIVCVMKTWATNSQPHESTASLSCVPLGGENTGACELFVGFREKQKGKILQRRTQLGNLPLQTRDGKMLILMSANSSRRKADFITSRDTLKWPKSENKMAPNCRACYE